MILRRWLSLTFIGMLVLLYWPLHASQHLNSRCQHFCTIKPTEVVFSSEWRKKQPLAQVLCATEYYRKLQSALKADLEAKNKASFVLTINYDGLLVESTCVFKHERCKLKPKVGLMLPVPPSNLLTNNELKIEIDL